MGKRTYQYIDIFSGCGGLSLGLYNSGWRGVFAIEKSPMAFKTLKHNLIDKKKHFEWPSWLPIKNHDIHEVMKKYKKELRKLEGKIDLVAGGPPCQGFSIAGKRKEKDQRNNLVESYIQFIKIVKPRFLFFENVKGFTIPFKKDGSEKAYSDYVLEELRKLGYNVEGKIIDFSEFGIPQRRKRFIIFGDLKNESGYFFEYLEKNRKNFLAGKNLKTKISVKEAISDLEKSNGLTLSPDNKRFKAGKYSIIKSSYQKHMRKEYGENIPDSHRYANHKSQTIEKFRYILDNNQKNKNIADNIKAKFKLKKRNITPLCSKQSSPTLTTLPDDYIHYKEPRILTVREYARIQSFNDWFEIKGSYTTGGKRRKYEVPRYTQIGNAVPPLFMEQCGVIIKEIAT